MAQTELAAPRAASALARAPSPALVLGAVASVQFGSAIATKLFDTIGPAGTVLLRLLFGTAVLLALWRPRAGAHTRRELALAGVFGLILAGMNLSFYESIDRIPLGVAVTLEFIGPLTIAVAGSRRARDLVWVALAAAGILALTRGTGHALDPLGVALALIAGCMWGAYILVGARVGRAFPGGSGLALAMCVGAVAMLPFGLAQGGAHLLEPRALVLGGAVGMLSTAIPYSLEIEALRRIRASVFGVLMSLEPAAATLAGFIVLGQSLGPRALLGIALVIAASAGAALTSSQAPVAS